MGKKRNQRGHRNPRWKGNGVGYSALHNWIRKYFKRPGFCEECNTTKAKKFTWANITGNYTRDRRDYKNFCDSCHKKHDGVVNNILNSEGKLPEETKKKLSMIHTGKTLSQEHRDGISRGLKLYYQGKGGG